MKIAFVIWSYSPSRGGQERYLSRLIGDLIGRGHEIHVFAARAEKEALEGIRFHRVPCITQNSFLKTVSFLHTARNMIPPGRYHIVSGMTRYYPLDVFRLGGGLHKVWMRKKADNIADRLFALARPFNWLALYLERKIFDPAHCSHIIANSRLCRNQLLSLYDYPAERVKVIYNGVDHETFHPRLRRRYRAMLRKRLGIPTDATVAAFLSNNLKRKGLKTALRAVSLCRKDRIYLLVAGGGKKGLFRWEAARLGVADRVRFLGLLSDVRPCYGAADFLVLPTRYDPFANVCLEALACGLPVITTRDNGAAEIIEEGVSGFIIADHSDSGGFARAMAAFADEGARRRASDAAREASLAYTIERNASQTLEIYNRVLEERNGGAH